MELTIRSTNPTSIFFRCAVTGKMFCTDAKYRSVKIGESRTDQFIVCPPLIIPGTREYHRYRQPPSATTAIAAPYHTMVSNFITCVSLILEESKNSGLVRHPPRSNLIANRCLLVRFGGRCCFHQKNDVAARRRFLLLVLCSIKHRSMI